MSFPIDVTIPNPNNNPADDCPKMRTNFGNISGYLSVDHVTPGAVGDGFHEQVTYFTENPPALLPTDTISIGFTGNLQAPTGVLVGRSTLPASQIAQLFFANQNGVFVTSGLRAFALITPVIAAPPNPATISNGFNVTSVTRTAVGRYSVVLATNSVVGSSFAIITDSGLAGPRVNYSNYTITGAGTFNLVFVNDLDVIVDPATFSFSVFQV